MRDDLQLLASTALVFGAGRQLRDRSPSLARRALATRAARQHEFKQLVVI